MTALRGGNEPNKQPNRKTPLERLARRLHCSVPYPHDGKPNPHHFLRLFEDEKSPKSSSSEPYAGRMVVLSWHCQMELERSLGELLLAKQIAANPQSVPLGSFLSQCLMRTRVH